MWRLFLEPFAEADENELMCWIILAGTADPNLTVALQASLHFHSYSDFVLQFLQLDHHLHRNTKKQADKQMHTYVSIRSIQSP